jgi:phage recombination protein Bet
MSTEISHRTPTGALAIQSAQEQFTEAQLEAFGLRGASLGEQLLFLHTCQRTGLDPAARQIYAISRMQWDPDTKERVKKLTIQVGIDGFRLIADRTHEYVGNETSGMGPVNPQTRAPEWVAVTVRRCIGGVDRDFKGVAYYDEYVQTKKDGTPNDMWRRMPRNMLAKCAEAQALRKAFPQDLSGLYTDDEMGPDATVTREAPAPPPVPQAPTTVTREPAPAPEPPAGVDLDTGEIVEAEVVEEPSDSGQWQRLAIIAGNLGMTSREDKHALIMAVCGRAIASAKDLTRAEAEHVESELRRIEQSPEAQTLAADIASGGTIL